MQEDEQLQDSRKVRWYQRIARNTSACDGGSNEEFARRRNVILETLKHTCVRSSQQAITRAHSLSVQKEREPEAVSISTSNFAVAPTMPKDSKNNLLTIGSRGLLAPRPKTGAEVDPIKIEPSILHSTAIMDPEEVKKALEEESPKRMSSSSSSNSPEKRVLNFSSDEDEGLVEVEHEEEDEDTSAEPFDSRSDASDAYSVPDDTSDFGFSTYLGIDAFDEFDLPDSRSVEKPSISKSASGISVADAPDLRLARRFQDMTAGGGQYQEILGKCSFDADVRGWNERFQDLMKEIATLESVR